MILDAQNSFSRNQAVSGAGASASTDSIDFGALNRQMGVGGDLYIVLNVKVAAGGTTPTLAVGVQVDDNSAFSSPATILSTQTFAAAALGAGAQIVIPMPVTGFEQYMRLNYTLGGTSPTITLDAHIVTSAQLAQLYPVGFSIQ